MYTFTLVVMLVIWLALLVLNLWVFQKSKALGNLLMMIGAAVLILAFFVLLVSTGIPASFVWAWLPMIGMLTFTAGFFLSVQPMVQAQLDVLKQKLHDVTSDKEPEQAAEEGEKTPEKAPEKGDEAQ